MVLQEAPADCSDDACDSLVRILVVADRTILLQVGDGDTARQLTIDAVKSIAKVIMRDRGGGVLSAAPEVGKGGVCREGSTTGASGRGGRRIQVREAKVEQQGGAHGVGGDQLPSWVNQQPLRGQETNAGVPRAVGALREMLGGTSRVGTDGNTVGTLVKVQQLVLVAGHVDSGFAVALREEHPADDDDVLQEMSERRFLPQLSTAVQRGWVYRYGRMIRNLSGSEDRDRLAPLRGGEAVRSSDLRWPTTARAAIKRG